MYQCLRFRLLTGLIWAVSRLKESHSEVYTASWKIENMVLQEENILNHLQAAVSETKNDTALKAFLNFRQQRIQAIHEREQFKGWKEYLNHPNGLYHSVVEFALEYAKLRSLFGNMTSPNVETYMSMIADSNDIFGASRSLIRLQMMYNLSVWNMTKGDYFGYMGPELGEIDVVEMGKTAFVDGYLNISLAWMQEALSTTIGHPVAANLNLGVSTPRKSYILAIIGAIYIRQGRIKEAQKMYKKAKRLDPTARYLLDLEQELKTSPEFRAPPSEDETFQRLCSQLNNLTSLQSDPRLNCVYRAATLPYYRFQQELVSISPYISVFYKFLTDSESDELLRDASTTLRRAAVQDGDTFKEHDIRTSQMSSLGDYESEVAADISKRIGAVTNLDTWKHFSKNGEAISSENLQIVNYGLGGSYLLHTDALIPINESANPEVFNVFRESGNRLSTFLIYLSDVAVGGATVFPNAGVSVKPSKNNAVFWYNYNPSGQADADTVHAGCPVVIGHKWIANKWIWSHENTFTRRCGLSENSSQLDIDPYMSNGWA